MLPRAQTVGRGKESGQEVMELVIRASSKPGAIITARLEAARTIPLRSQKVVKADTQDNARFFDKWEVVVADTKEAESMI
jgi:hypothetical protein